MLIGELFYNDDGDDGDDGLLTEKIGPLEISIFPEEEITWAPVYSWVVFHPDTAEDLLEGYAPSLACAHFCARMAAAFFVPASQPVLN